jgi:hypothetical protein
VIARDLHNPRRSPFEVLSAAWPRDDAPLEERRTQAVSAALVAPEQASDLTPDAAAIARVKSEAWPDAATPTSF